MPSWICCATKGGGRQREDSYKVADPSNKYSWEDRASCAMDNYKVSELVGKLELRSQIGGQQMVVENCKDSVIVFADRTACVTIDDCINCLIVMGPCAGSVFVRDCVNCTVVAVCQQLRTRDCQQLDLAIHCTTHPIIENSRPVVLHPIHINYQNIKEDIRSCGLSPFSNHWTNVHDFTPDKYTPNYSFSKENVNLSPVLKSLFSEQSDVSLSPEDSFLPVRNVKKVDADGASQDVKVLFTLQSKTETVEVLYDRCLTTCEKLLAGGSAITDTRDILAVKRDIQDLVPIDPTFVSGHVVVLWLKGDSGEMALRQFCTAHPDWTLLETPRQEAFTKLIDRLAYASLSI